MNHHRAMRINHPAFEFGHAGITFEVSPTESVWFSVDRFVEESEYITLDTARDGSEVGYCNLTECFGGRFTGV